VAQEGDERDVSRCWMTLRKQEDTGSWRRKFRIAIFGDLRLEEAMDLSQDKLLLDLDITCARRYLSQQNGNRHWFLPALCWIIAWRTV
jgi:hypothetical protein